MAKSRSSGAKAKSQSAKVTKPVYFAETEKAVQLEIVVDYYDIEKSKASKVWVPKSQLDANGRPTEWITEMKTQDVAMSGRGGYTWMGWRDAQGNSFQPGKSEKQIKWEKEREKKFEAGKKSYDALIKQAKDMGVKGVRVGMRRKTIEKKIADFKNKK